MAKVYSVFLCVLLISVLFFPLTSAGRVLLDKPQKDDVSGKHSNGGNKIGVEGSYSSPDHSARGHASPFHATPSILLILLSQVQKARRIMTICGAKVSIARDP
ncbi:uncharacterized protein LOC117912043 isoform X2 [Vitis riparia]|uniref:uncharacterized protein LOC117912043 isoform X2 n=1 Tax=Vitis riparia TaxID=96939 RepID=UPI00155A2415|nr:uncharacterized protein LOC117912043 isoform X2 [Vitis riparia]